MSHPGDDPSERFVDAFGRPLGRDGAGDTELAVAIERTVRSPSEACRGTSRAHAPQTEIRKSEIARALVEGSP
jgi:hypothetical protein